MNESLRNKCASILALAAALAVPGLLPQSAHGMYDPKHGRWLQRDPIGYVDGQNLYQYAVSNPSRLVDPNGTDVIGDCGCEFTIKAAGIDYIHKVPVSGGLIRYYARNPRHRIYPGVRNQIILGMLLSKYTFVLRDGKPESWEEHILAREAVVSRAKALDALPHIKLEVKAKEKFNEVYWSGSGTVGWGPKDGNKAAESLTDPWNNPLEYATGCANQTLLILGAAAVDFYGAGAVSEAWRSRTAGDPSSILQFVKYKYYTERSEADTLWIPGERGYYRSSGEGYKGPPGLGGIFEGWFVISVESHYSSKEFKVFAPASGGPRIVTTREVAKWVDEHYSKPGAWDAKRTFPRAGLEK